MTFEQKKEAAKVLARSIMNTMVEQNVPLEDRTEILGMTTAAICGAPPEHVCVVSGKQISEVEERLKERKK